MLQCTLLFFQHCRKHNLNSYSKCENKQNVASISCEWKYYRIAATKASQSSEGGTQLHLQREKEPQPTHSPAVGTKDSSVWTTMQES